MKIKTGDKVVVIRGKNRGKVSRVLSAHPSESRLIVEGVNMRKKHMRPRKQGEKGQIVDLPAPIFISNVKLICDKCKKPTRVGYKIDGADKYRVCKKCNEAI